MLHPNNLRRGLCRIGVGIIEMPYPIPRGKPDGTPGQTWQGRTVLVHMHKKQHRPGMKESFSPLGDYPPGTICGNGAYHLWMCDDPNFVTCPKCLSEMKGKFEITPAWEAAQHSLKLVEAAMTSDVENEMFEDDYKFSPCGPLGGKVGVTQGSTFLGDFPEMDDALKFVIEINERDQYWPSMYWVSDHGNFWQIDREGNEIKKNH